MKVYTVQRMDKIEYDFSVEVTNHGCYMDKEKAVRKANKVYKNMCKEYENQMLKYSDANIYDQDDDESGALYVEEDHENGYYAIAFGPDENYESHVIGVDEWIVQ